MLPPYSALIDTPSGALRPVLEPSTQGHGVVQAGPEEGHKDDQRAETPPLYGKAESSSAPVEKRRLQGDLGVAFQYLKGPTGKLGRDFLSGQVATGQGEMALNWKRVDLDYISG